MKPFRTSIAIRVALAGGTALFTCATWAQTWQTVDNFQYVPGRIAEPRGATADAQGNVYIVGMWADAAQPRYFRHAITRRSTDHGQTWVTVDDLIDPVSHDAWFTAAGVDAAQNVYVVGVTSASGPSPSHALIRKSSDGGNTWSTVVDMAHAGILTIWGTPSFGADASGRIYAAFCNASPILLLRSADFGQTWAAVQTIPTVVAMIGGYYGTPTGICADLQGDVWLAGPSSWQVIKVSNGGATRTTLMVSRQNSAYDMSVACDSLGYLYLAGLSSYADGSNHGLIYKSSDDGATWTQVDDCLNDYEHAFACDPAGNVYVCGRTGLDWTVRKQAGP